MDRSKPQTGPGGIEGFISREASNLSPERARLAPDSRALVYTIGHEMQLVDDAAHPDFKNNSGGNGALYGIFGPMAAPASLAGEWNSGRIVLRGDLIEHWINGVKVIDASFADPCIRQDVEKRWGQYPLIVEMLTRPEEGPICLQHHSGRVWFRNLKIRRLSR